MLSEQVGVQENSHRTIVVYLDEHMGSEDAHFNLSNPGFPKRIDEVFDEGLGYIRPSRIREARTAPSPTIRI
jgi:hypothetical protein